MPVPYLPITVPNRGPTRSQYMTVRRWLHRLTGPTVKTTWELRRALKQPEVFYLVPKEFR